MLQNTSFTKKTPVMCAYDVSFSYDGAPVLSSVSLEVYSGEILGILGPNGAGKSTLLSLLAGDEKPCEGYIEVDGILLDGYKRKKLAQKRSVMPQKSDFPFAYTVEDIVLMGRYPWDTTVEEDEKIVHESMRRADVDRYAHRDVTQLSGGEQSRVTFARVIAGQTKIVLLDEPTAALDIAHQEHMMHICKDLASQGCAVVALMHDIQLAAAYCDRIALMARGDVVRVGNVGDVIRSDLLSTVYNWNIDVQKLDDGTLVVVPKRSFRELDA